jgi:hypothetical protein
MSDKRFDFGKLMMAVIIVIIAYFAFAISGAFAQDISADIGATPSTGTSPLNTVVGWSSVNADRCWRNNTPVPLNGSEYLIGLTADRTETLRCESGINYTTIWWTAPTSNVDGTPIPATGPQSLAGFELQYATTVAGLESAPIYILPPTAASYVIVDLTNSTYYYRLNAFNEASARSDWSGTVSNVINVRTATDSVFIDVTAPTKTNKGKKPRR